MEWILFDKDGTLIEFDRSWERIVRFVQSLLETFPVHNKEVAGDNSVSLKNLLIQNQ